MRTVSKDIFNFSELSKSAKEKAIENVRTNEGYPFYDWFEDTINDYREACALIGIDIPDGKVYFSGFSCQGDGACFEATYEYKKGGLKDLKHEFPTLTDLHDVAKALQDLQSKYFYGINAIIKHSGHYMHSNCTTLDYYVSRTDKSGCKYDDHFSSDDFYDEATSLFRSIMNMIYKALEEAWDYINKDEQVKEYISDNCIEFEESGKTYSVHA